MRLFDEKEEEGGKKKVISTAKYVGKMNDGDKLIRLLTGVRIE